VTDAASMRAYLGTNLDALALDDISGTRDQTNTFRLDVPDGEYRVWVLTGAST
jgi:hypothetical protein